MTPEQLLQYRQQLMNARTNLRSQEKNIRAQERSLQGMGETAGNSGPQSNQIKTLLSKMLPPDLIPGNVGDIEYAQWGYYYSLEFDFGLNPVLNNTFMQTQQVQVDQMGAFLLTDISVNFDVYDTAGELGPWQIDITDPQSRRQINTPPISLQSIGGRSRPSRLKVPMVFYPNSQMQITASTWLQAGENVATAGGEASFEIALWGIRVYTQAISVATDFNASDN